MSQRNLWRFVAPTARKALTVGAKEAVVSPHPRIPGLYRVELSYYFAAKPKKKRDKK